MLTNAALLTYVIPSSFLAIPFYRIMKSYGLADNALAVIAVEVTFATPYAIFIFQQYSASIPHELDEAARIDGASPPQIFFCIYLPLMAPALVAIGTYALLLAWNEYLVRVPVVVLGRDDHRTGRAREIPQQRRGALELSDGRGDPLRAPAVGDLLHLPALYERGAHHGRGEGIGQHVTPEVRPCESNRSGCRGRRWA